MTPSRLIIVETHPIQYKVPWFQRLSRSPELDITVLFAMVPNETQQGDGFGVSFAWDVPMLEGYAWRELENVASTPSVTHFRGCDTPSLFQLISRDTADAVLVNGWVAKTCLQALVASRRAGVPCIVRGEANDLRRRTWWKRRLQRLLVRRYAAALYIGEANRQFYLARGVNEDRLFFGPYCVDNQRFRDAAEATDRAAQRERWHIPPASFCFLFSGKLQAKKRPLDALAALQRQGAWSGDGRAVHMLVVGDGPMRTECERYADEHGLPVTFAGFLNQSDMPAAYAVADGLVLPSDSGETWGLVVNEAMACGIPSIVSDQVGCAADLVHPGQTGYTFACGDVSALAARMHDLVCHGGLSAEACRGRVWDYGYDALVAGTVESVQAVCRGRSGVPERNQTEGGA